MRVAPMFLALSLIAAGCGGDADNCTPGSKTACACPGAIQSTKTCLADGSDYGACVCEGGTGGFGGGSGGTSPSTSTTTSASSASASDASSSASTGGAANSSSTASAGGASSSASVGGASSSSSAGGAGGASSSASAGGGGGAISSEGVTWSAVAEATSSNGTFAGLAVDAADNVFITGTFGVAIDFGGGTTLSANSGAIYLAKYDSGGSVLWAKPFPGTASVFAIAGDSNGNVVIGGSFTLGMDFGFGTALSTTTGSEQFAFLAKFDTNGNCLWQKQFGGDEPTMEGGLDDIESLAIDSVGNIVLIGKFMGALTIGSSSATNSDVLPDFFIASVDPNGTPRWAHMLSTANNPMHVAVDAMGDVVVAAQSNGPLITPTLKDTCSSEDCLSLLKFDTSGNLLFASAFGNGANVQGLGVDAAGDIAFAGGAEDSQLSFVDAPIAPPASTATGYVARFDAWGGFLEAAVYGATGVQSNVFPSAFACAADGSCELAGGFAGDAIMLGCGSLRGDLFTEYTARFDSSLGCVRSEEVQTPRGGANLSSLGFASNGDTIAGGVYSGTVDFGGGPWPVPAGTGVFLVRTSP